MKYLLHVSSGPINYIKLLLEKWITFSYYFSGEVTVPLCMAALCELLINKWEILKCIRVEIDHEERKAPSAILKAFLQYIFNSSNSNNIKEIPQKVNFDEDFDDAEADDMLYGNPTLQPLQPVTSKDEYEPEINRKKDADLSIYPEIATYCGKMSKMMDRITEFRLTHKAEFEEWKAELDEDDQERLNLHFPLGS